MLPLIKVCLSRTTGFLILATVILAVAETQSLAEQPAEVSQRESLRGISGVEVIVEPLNIELEELGLQTQKLQQDVKHRLQKAGLKVLTARERLASSAAATLVVRVDALHDRIARFFYSIDLLILQRVDLGGRATPEVVAATWMKLGAVTVIADDKVTHIGDQVTHKVDQFIKDYVAGNPQ